MPLLPRLLSFVIMAGDQRMLRDENRPRLLGPCRPNKNDLKLRMTTNSPRQSGFTLLEIMIILAIIGLLAAIAIPNFLRSRAISQKTTCINNLRQLEGAVTQFALENKKSAASSVDLTDCTPYLRSSVVCPAGGTSITDSYLVVDCRTTPSCTAAGGGTANAHELPQ
jgi:prepilin-type N-terminal cleavage/methylation domain-containing protein